jgi:hypothetical protein
MKEDYNCKGNTVVTHTVTKESREQGAERSLDMIT